MLFSLLSEAFDKIEATSGRLDMTDILAELFKKTPASEIEHVIFLSQGELAPPFEGIDLGLGEKYAMDAISLSYGYSRSEVEKLYKKMGDLGTVAQELAGKKKQHSLASEELTVSKVFTTFMKLSSLEGKGSQESKIKMLAELLNSATPVDAKYLIRFPLGRLRLGVGDPTIIDALSVYRAGDKSLRIELERAYNLCSDLGFVAKTFFDSPEKIKHFQIHVFKPIRPALAERLSSSEEIIEKLGKCAIDAKYDGLRMQVHKKKDKIEIYSRKLERMTEMFPEIVEAARQLPADELIFEGEALAYNEKEKRYYSFQQTIQRKRKYGVEAMRAEFPLRLFAFDLLFQDGMDFTVLPYKVRRVALEKLVAKNKTIVPSNQIIASDSLQVEKFFNDSLGAGLEGIIAKDLDAPYVAGARKFAWIKLKRSYGAMADSVDAVIVGYYLGKGQRAEFEFGGLLVAVLNTESGRYETIARIGSGFSEDEMQLLQEQLEKIKTKEKPKELDSKVTPDFWVKLKYVISVSADEITLSPMHTCGLTGSGEDAKGYALRFPRMTSLRDDKSPKEVTTTEEIIKMFELQKK